MDILEHLGMLVPDIEGHGVITGRASISHCIHTLLLQLRTGEGARMKCSYLISKIEILLLLLWDLGSQLKCFCEAVVSSVWIPGPFIPSI